MRPEPRFVVSFHHARLGRRYLGGEAGRLTVHARRGDSPGLPASDAFRVQRCLSNRPGYSGVVLEVGAVGAA